LSSKGTAKKRKAEDPHPWRIKNCPSKKFGFPSGEEARLYAKMASSKTLDLMAYKCRYCEHWHVASDKNGKVDVKVHLNETPKEG
jgi:hypothetical protein